MRKLRDVLYINAFPDSNEFVYYGLTFQEFYKSAPIKPQNILLLESEYWGTGFSSKCRMITVEQPEIEELLGEDIYSYGDFCWVDYNDGKNIDSLEPQEIAELLYLGHMFSPLKSPFFDRIENRYAYLAHDDGWFCRLYCKHYKDFSDIIASQVIYIASTSKRRKIYPMSEELKEQLLLLCNEGLLIDFSNMLKFDKSIEIPIYQIGKFLSMDSMYNDLKTHIGRARYSAKLVHKNKNWVIDYIKSRD